MGDPRCGLRSAHSEAKCAERTRQSVDRQGRLAWHSGGWSAIRAHEAWMRGAPLDSSLSWESRDEK